MLAKLYFKEDEDEKAWEQIDWRCRILVNLARTWSAAMGSDQLTVTSVTSGVHAGKEHEELRAVDLRIWQLGIEPWEEFGNLVNSIVCCAGHKPVVLVGKLDPNGKHQNHCHIQVSPPYEGSANGSPRQI